MLPSRSLNFATGLIFLIADARAVYALDRHHSHSFERHLGGHPARRHSDPCRHAVLMSSTWAERLWFAGWPALRDGTPSTALVNGAILGFVAYGTYELTSWTVMRQWHPSMVAVDMAWGTRADRALGMGRR